MTDVSHEKLRDELLALPAEERAKLAHVLLESLDEGTDADTDAYPLHGPRLPRRDLSAA